MRIRSIATPHKASIVLYQWAREEVFYVDKQTIVVKIPKVNELGLLDSASQTVIFEVSVNGVDWTSETTEAQY